MSLLDFSHGPYGDLPSPTQSLEFPAFYTAQLAWPEILEATEAASVVGINGEAEATHNDWDHDSPHVLVQATTGGGKTTVARSLLAQALRTGSIGTILDYKRISHRWAKDLPNVGYAKTMSEIGNALCELGREVHRRNAIVDEHGEDADVGPRIVVVFEELNATMGELMKMSRRIPAGTYTAMDGLRDVLFMGRAARVHMVGLMQFPDFRIISQALMECFSLRIMLDYTKNVWVKIAWDCGLPIACPPQKLRARAVRGGKSREIQVLSLTEEECKAMARQLYSASCDSGVVSYQAT